MVVRRSGPYRVKPGNFPEERGTYIFFSPPHAKSEVDSVGKTLMSHIGNAGKIDWPSKIIALLRTTHSEGA